MTADENGAHGAFGMGVCYSGSYGENYFPRQTIPMKVNGVAQAFFKNGGRNITVNRRPENNDTIRRPRLIPRAEAVNPDCYKQQPADSRDRQDSNDLCHTAAHQWYIMRGLPKSPSPVPRR